MTEPAGQPSCTAPTDAATASGGRLASMLACDQQIRWRQGDPVPVEAYLRQHPNLRDDSEGLLDLICGEWALREQFGETLQVEEYVGRFPELEHSLKMQWEVHAVCRAMRRESSRPTLSGATPSVTVATDANRPDLPAVPGYELLEVLGAGGMGIVYKARHLGLNRLVALKMLRGGAMADHTELARFQLEAEAVARLRHPHIVQIYDIGSWSPGDGGPAVPYLSLEFVDGGSLAKHLARNPLPARAAAELIEMLARAMDCAHRQGIVHRDLKPANILLQKTEIRNPKSESESGSISGLRIGISDFLPKITDFGLAKRLDTDSEQTRTGAVMGTPSYMAPEQAEGRAKDVSPVTDVYALGAILYEALTGRPPFKGTSVLDTLEQVKLLDPVVPRRLQPGVPRDLETICLKCLAKEPRKRYSSAAALADDLRRFLDGKPILARPTPVWEQVWKAAKRRPGVTVLLGLICAVTVAGFLGIFNQWRRAERNGEQQRRITHTFGINLTQQVIERSNTSRALELLNSLKPQPGQSDLRGFEWYYLNGVCHGEALSVPGSGGVAMHPDGSYFAAGSEQGDIRIWDTAGREIAPLHGHAGNVTALAFSPDGKLLVSAAEDNHVKVWDWQAGVEKVHLPTVHTKWPLALATSPDGSLAVSGGLDGTVVLWDLTTGTKQRALRSPEGSIVSLAFHPDGRTLAAAVRAGQVLLWNLKQADAQPESIDHHEFGSVSGLAFSPDGQYLATAVSDKTIRIWEAGTREPVCVLRGHTAEVACVAFAPTGTTLVSGGWDRTIQVRDLSSIPDLIPQPLVLRGHTGFVTALSCDRTGRHVASVGMDKTARLWDLDAPRAERALASGGGEVHCLAYSPDGKSLATAGPDRIVRIREGVTAPPIALAGHLKPINAVVFSPNGRELASGDDAGVIIIWDVFSRQPARTLRGPGSAITWLTFSPDGRLLASSARDGSVRLWDAATGEELGELRGHEGAVHAVAFSPDGRTLASAGADHTVRTWDVGRRTELRVLHGHAQEVLCVAFDASGKRLATGGEDRSTILWDVASGRQLFTLSGHDGKVVAVAFHSTDARRLATAGYPENIVKVWDLDTRQELLTLPGPPSTSCLTFRPDGDELIAGGGVPRHGQLKVWSATPGRTAEQ